MNRQNCNHGNVALDDELSGVSWSTFDPVGFERGHGLRPGGWNVKVRGATHKQEAYIESTVIDIVT
jgi:hypothetical protein